MDFDLTEDQQAIRDLAGRILGDRLPAEELRARERAGEGFPADVWHDLGQAGLLGLHLPEAQGGAGLGLLEACLVAEQIGRAVAPVPFVAGAVGAGSAVAAFGTEEQRTRLLPGLSAGDDVLTVALHEPVEVEVPRVPATQAVADGEGWRLRGEKVCAPAADRAVAMVVPARTGEAATTAFLVDPGAAGVELVAEETVTGERRWTVRLEDVAVGADAVLGEVDRGGAVVRHVTDRMLAAQCAMQTGVCEEALALTARYVTTREQFGVRLGTFQAVGHRVADAYIDTEAIRLTALQAIWRLDAGLDATDALLTAKYWAAEGAQRVVHAAQHLHGGIGVDLDYPIHRYFRWAKVLELDLGGATPSLLRLGAHLVDQPVR